MARTVVVDHRLATRTPYLRGILTRSLQGAGLTFEQAYALASQLRAAIAHLDEISAHELRERVMRMLEEQYESAVHERYKAGGNSSRSLLIRGMDQQLTPFSRGLHQQTLEAIGIAEQRARNITTGLHNHLLAEGATEISSQQLGHLTYQAIDSELGEETAGRYLTWSAFRRSDRPLIILIGGAPGCGKSTIAVELANRMEIVRTQSTDMLREVMRMMMPERLAPVLHTSSFNAWKVLPEPELDTSPERKNQAMADGYRAQAELLSVPCEAVVRRALREQVSLILEGVHIQPTLLEKLPLNDSAIVVPMMLAVMEPEDLRARIRGRGGLVPQRQAERYLRHFDGIWHLQSLLLADADALGTPIVDSSDRTAAVQEAIRCVIEAIAPEFAGDVETVFGPRH